MQRRRKKAELRNRNKILLCQENVWIDGYFLVAKFAIPSLLKDILRRNEVPSSRLLCSNCHSFSLWWLSYRMRHNTIHYLKPLLSSKFKIYHLISKNSSMKSCAGNFFFIFCSKIWKILNQPFPKIWNQFISCYNSIFFFLV